MVDKDKDSKKDDTDNRDNEDDSETSITSDKSRVPTIDIFGTKVKLDTLTFAGIFLGALGAAAGGYYLYNQYNQNKQADDARKEDEKRRQQDYMNQYYMRQQQQIQAQAQQRKGDLLPPSAQKQYQAPKVDMSKHQPPEPVEYEPTIQDYLGSKSNVMPFYPSTQNIFSTTPASPLIKNESVSSTLAGPEDNQNIGFIDMDRFYTPGQTQSEYPLPEANPINKNKLEPDEEEEIVEEEGPTNEELYQQLGSSYNY